MGVFFSIPGQTIGVSVFTDPVKDALGLSRNQFSNAYMIGTIASSLLMGVQEFGLIGLGLGKLLLWQPWVWH